MEVVDVLGFLIFGLVIDFGLWFLLLCVLVLDGIVFVGLVIFFIIFGIILFFLVLLGFWGFVFILIVFVVVIIFFLMIVVIVVIVFVVVFLGKLILSFGFWNWLMVLLIVFLVIEFIISFVMFVKGLRFVVGRLFIIMDLFGNWLLVLNVDIIGSFSDFVFVFCNCFLGFLFSFFRFDDFFWFKLVFFWSKFIFWFDEDVFFFNDWIGVVILFMWIIFGFFKVGVLVVLVRGWWLMELEILDIVVFCGWIFDGILVFFIWWVLFCMLVKEFRFFVCVFCIFGKFFIRLFFLEFI